MQRRYEHINIPIEIIRTLVAVADHGSYSKAANKLALSQPAITAQIKRLQIMIGGPVFHRSGNGVALTERGSLVLAHARKILEANDQILAVGGGASHVQPVRLGLCALFAEEFFKTPAIKHELGARLIVECAHSTELEQSLVEGYLDIACLISPSGRVDKPVDGWSEDFVWARSPDFVLSPGAPIPIITWPNRHEQQPAISSLEQAGLAYRIVFTSNDYSSRVAAAASGIGLTAMPARHIDRPLVVASEYYLPKLEPIPVGICVRSGVASREVDSVIAQLKQLAPGERNIFPNVVAVTMPPIGRTEVG